MKSRASPSARTTTSGLSHTSRLMNAPSRWLPRTPRTSYRSSPHCLECSSTLHRSATDLSGSMSRVLGSTPGGSQWLRSADPPACGSTTSSLGTGSQCHSPIRPVLGDLHPTDGCWSKERLGAPTQCGSSLSRMGKFISKTVDTTYLGFHGPPSRSLKAKPALRWSACNRWAGFPATSVGLATGCQRVMGTSSAYWTGTRCCEYSQHPLSSPSPLRDRVARRAGSLASMGPRLPRPAVVGTSGTARACTTWKNAAGPVPGRSRGGRRGGVTRTASAGLESSGSIPRNESTPLLLSPKIEYPPFDDEIAVRVVGTQNCLPLREEPGTDGPVEACPREGSRLVVPKRSPGPVRSPPFNTSLGLAEGARWVYVRTGDGVEGWVSHDYLEHD